MVIFEDKEFRYRIVLPEQATSQEQLAAKELKVFLKEACGKSIEIIKDSAVVGKDKDLYLFVGTPLRRQFVRTIKYIFIGNTKEAKENGFVVSAAEVSKTGYMIKTFEGDIFINGATGFGTIYGVYDFLKQTVGFEVYAHDEIFVEKKTTIEFPETDIKFKPYVEWREAMQGQPFNNAVARMRMRFNAMGSDVFFDEWGGPHTTFRILSPAKYMQEHPEWYSDMEQPKPPSKHLEDRSAWAKVSTMPKQLCYTAHGNEKALQEMRETVLESMKKATLDHLKRGYLPPYISFTHEDNNVACNCKHCVANREKYGTEAASVIQFLNPVAEELNAWLQTVAPGEKINIVFFAYYCTEKAPVKQNKAGEYVPIDDGVKMSKYLSVWYAPYWADYGSSFYAEVNEPYYETLKRWSALCSDILFWGYGGLGGYMYMHDTFGVMFETYKMAKEFNFSYYFDQGRYNANVLSGFGDFQLYLNSKLLWGFNQDYATLKENFFDNYYGAASKAMQNIFEETRKHCEHMRTLGFRFACNYHDFVSRKYWPRKKLETFIQSFDAAFAALKPMEETQPERYRQIFDRICREKVSYTYMLLELYAREIPEDELDARRSAWRSEVLRLGFSHKSEGARVYSYWEDWQ